MDMSLDDYINSFKKSETDKNPNDIYHKEESKFKEGRRELNENDDEDLVLKCEEDDYVSLALNNPDSTLASIESNDLRHKIGRLPSANSQQWRLMHPNVVHTRPAGMPPLVPTDSVPDGISGNRNNRRNNKNRHRNWFGKQNCNGNNNNNNNNNNNRNYGRIQRFGNNCRSNVNSKDIKTVLQQLKDRNPMILYTAAGAPDLTIEATTSEQDRKSTTTISIPQLIKSNSQQVVMEPESSGPSKGSEAIKSLLGVNEVSLRNEMIPALAGKLLDFLNGVNPSVHKPQYDMKIQREIHEIQKKPLLYRCPGGEVVSSDGVGIPNCRIQPKASGVSLNNRFA